MLDIIFASRTFDLGATFGWGGILADYQKLDRNFASRFEATIPKAEAKLEETLELIG